MSRSKRRRNQPQPPLSSSPPTVNTGSPQQQLPSPPSPTPTAPSTSAPNGSTLSPVHNVEKMLGETVNNILLFRREFLNTITDPRRDIDDECGFPKQISQDMYAAMYEREAIAARAVEVLPKESWQVQPTVYEDESADNVTPFEEAWDNLGRQLRGEQSYFQDEEGSPIWEYLQRVDILSGIGQYGILLLGLDDGRRLDEPVEGFEMGYPSAPDTQPDPASPVDVAAKGAAPYGGLVPLSTDAQYFQQRTILPTTTSQPNGTTTPSSSPNGATAKKEKTKKPPTKILFIRVFPETLVQITQFEADSRSPRFGQPLMYLVTFNDPRGQNSGVGLPLASANVHWSRIIHVADNLSSSEVFGIPRMQQIFNNLLGLRKLYGAGPEGYWQSCFTGLSFETHPELGGDVEIDRAGLREMYENYRNGLQRALFLMGMSAKTLAPTVVDPSPQISAQIEAICIKLGIPVRVFKGSERGELASGQDDASWNDRLRARERDYLTPRLIVPLVDRLISVGVLPRPKTQSKGKLTLKRKPGEDGKNRDEIRQLSGGYSISWPDLDSQTDQEQATIAATKTTALSQYVAGGVEAVIPPMEYLTKVFGMTEEEAQAVIDAASSHAEDKMDEQLQQQKEQAKLQPPLTPIPPNQQPPTQPKQVGGIPPPPQQQTPPGKQPFPNTPKSTAPTPPRFTTPSNAKKGKKT